jgi:NADPH:quinone reductase-like Zn-dependent oxidoreductase
LARNFDHGGLSDGQRILIHGAAGGVGHFAVQFARASDATVYASCSGDDVDFVRGLGADEAIDYRNQKIEDIAHDVDVLFDLVAGETQDRSWMRVRPDMPVETEKAPCPWAFTMVGAAA